MYNFPECFDNLRLVLPIGLIPDKSVVTKPTGSKQYRLHHNFPFAIYGVDGDVMNVAMPEEARYLVPVDADGEISIQVVANVDQKVAVSFRNLEELSFFVDELQSQQGEEK